MLRTMILFFDQNQHLLTAADYRLVPHTVSNIMRGRTVAHVVVSCCQQMLILIKKI